MFECVEYACSWGSWVFLLLRANLAYCSVTGIMVSCFWAWFRVTVVLGKGCGFTGLFSTGTSPTNSLPASIPRGEVV